MSGAASGRVAIVAGGAGGIGAAIAAALRDEGMRVWVLDRQPGASESVTCDLSDAAAVTRAVAGIEAREGRIDVVVHSAGVTRDGRLWKLTDDDWRTVMSVNLDSAFYLLRAATPALRRQGGAVVFVSSINGERGKVGQAAYAASKAGMNALARTAARELGHFGIRVNVVAPGWIDTPMTAAVPAEARATAVAESVLERVGRPEDVARAVRFLTGPDAAHVTGQILRVDGGQLIG